MSTWLTGPAPVVIPVVAELLAEQGVSVVPVLRTFNPDIDTGFMNIRFTENAYYLRQQITRPLVFAIDSVGAVPFVTVDLQLVADGRNTPLFSAFKTDQAQPAFDGTVGTVNYVRFWFTGTEYMHSIIRTAAGTTTVPRITSASKVSNGVVQLTLTGSDLDTGVVPPISAFSVTNNGSVASVTNVTVVSASSITLALGRDTMANDIVTYTMPTEAALANTTSNRLGCVSLGIDAPVCTAAPTLPSTSPLTGTSLAVASNGTWSSTTPVTYSYAWCHAATGTRRGTANSYTPDALDRAQKLLCIVKASNSNGSAYAQSTKTDIVAVLERLSISPTAFIAVVEVPNGVGYNYGTSANLPEYNHFHGGSTITTSVLPASATTGSIACVYGRNGVSTDEIFIGISHMKAHGTISMPCNGIINADYGIFINGPSRTYGIWKTNGASASVTASGIQSAENHILRVRKHNITTWVAEYSNNGGTSFSPIFANTATNNWTLAGNYQTYDFNGMITFCGMDQVRLPRTVNFV